MVILKSKKEEHIKTTELECGYEEEPAEDPVKPSEKKKSIFRHYFFLIPEILAILLFMNMCCKGNIVPSESMEPVIKKSSIIVTHWDLSPERGDVVVFKHDGIRLVKRVIGLGGDTIEISGGSVYRNGEKLNEPYVNGQATYNADSSVSKTFKVPEGYMFVLGDNRGNSKDSRFFEDPYIKVPAVISKAYLDIPLKESGGITKTHKIK